MEQTAQCTRCKRVRLVKFLFDKKNYSGKMVKRCRAKSVCSSIARRNTNPNPPSKKNK